MLCLHQENVVDKTNFIKQLKLEKNHQGAVCSVHPINSKRKKKSCNEQKVLCFAPKNVVDKTIFITQLKKENNFHNTIKREKQFS